MLGILLGRNSSSGSRVSQPLLGLDFPLFDTSVDTAPEAAISLIMFLYGRAAVFNLRIPRTDAPLQPVDNVFALVQDFSRCNARLWGDRLGQISLATTTVLWGVFGNLRLIVFAWAAAALGFGTAQASKPRRRGGDRLGGRCHHRVDDDEAGQAISVIPLAISVGFLMIGLNLISNLWTAVPFLIIMGGDLRLPDRADERAAPAPRPQPDGAGRSIAVQNFNEQACILGLGALYTGMTRFGMSAFGAITVFGLVVAGTMYAIRRWHAYNCIHDKDEVEHLLAIARSDKHH